MKYRGRLLRQPDRLAWYRGVEAVANFIKNVVTVLSAFAGIRGKKNHESATASLTPLQVIITGIVAAALFVITLIVGVRILISIV